MNLNKIIIRAILAFVCIMIVYGTISHFIPFKIVQQKSILFKQLVEKNYYKAVVIYIIVFVVSVALTLPIAIPLALAGGFLFGTALGGCYTTLATTLGCVTAFLFFRHVLGDTLRKKYGNQISHFNNQIKEYGPNYLLILHYSAIFPYFIINSFAALTNMKFLAFLRATVFGCLPLSFIYAFAGRQFGEINSLKDIFSFEIAGALVVLMVLAFLPILIKKFKESPGSLP